MSTQSSNGKCPMSEINTVSDSIITYMTETLKKKYENENPRRAFHAKSIGLVEATITVESDLDPRLSVGLFKEPSKTYQAWIRFSNGSPNHGTADVKKAARGMAIKIYGIDNEQFYSGDPDANTQDIILLSSQLFYPGPGNLQLLAAKTALGNWWQQIFYGLRLLSISLKKGLAFLKSRIITPNILEEFYYSCSPYAFGPSDKIKWAARPLKTVTSIMPDNPGEHFLRDRLIEDLSTEPKGPEHEVAFELLVQFQEDENLQPIEDSAVIWKTPFHRVAIITIPPQNLDTIQRKQKDMDMFFCPGHALAEHAPLGSLNQIRSIVYKNMAKERLMRSKESVTSAT